MMTPLSNGLRALGLALALVMMGPMALARDYIVAVVEAEPITNLEVQLTARWRALLASLPPPNPTPAQLRSTLDQVIVDRVLYELSRGSDREPNADELDQAFSSVAGQLGLTPEALQSRAAARGISAAAARQLAWRDQQVRRLAERVVPGRIVLNPAEVEQAFQARKLALANQNPEFDLGHIFWPIAENASPAERERIQAEARETLQQLKNGADFAQLARARSQGSEREQGGRMGLRPLERYPSLFADAVRNLPVGGLTEVLSSGAGLHILRVLERRGSATLTTTETRVRHILLRQGGRMNINQARAELLSFKQAIDAGRADFAQLAREYSQDGSATQGGDLGWIAPGMFVPEFEQVMNQLTPGVVSDPVVSRFGVHLIQVLARRQAPISEAELRESVRNALRAQRFDATYAEWAQEQRARVYVELRDPPQ